MNRSQRLQTYRRYGQTIQSLLTIIISVGKQVLLLCSPTALIVLLYSGFGEQYGRALAIVLAVLVISLSIWSLLTGPVEQSAIEKILSGWFYNVTVFGATVFATWYAHSVIQYVFLLGFPLVAVEFNRHITTGT